MDANRHFEHYEGSSIYSNNPFKLRIIKFAFTWQPGKRQEAKTKRRRDYKKVGKKRKKKSGGRKEEEKKKNKGRGEEEEKGAEK